MIAAKVAMDTARRTPRAERPASDPRVISARRRACVGRVRKNCALRARIPLRQKSQSIGSKAQSFEMDEFQLGAKAELFPNYFAAEEGNNNESYLRDSWFDLKN